MDKLEKLIYSVKYLPHVLYFGSLALIICDTYFYFIGERQFLNQYVQTLLTFTFFYMIYLAGKNLKKNK
ncbi:MAG: hypothetical protein CND26_02320 [Bacteroidetes bacterium MED-G13]|nr:MAG: hypothetical protein CND26_02320 [Bacteroidetes bacterium MED-G13]